jgi:hypothetical protein
MEHAFSTRRSTRHGRGLKPPISACSTDQLFELLTTAIATTNQVAQFIAELQSELVLRGEIPAEPFSVD